MRHNPSSFRCGSPVHVTLEGILRHAPFEIDSSSEQQFYSRCQGPFRSTLTYSNVLSTMDKHCSYYKSCTHATPVPHCRHSHYQYGCVDCHWFMQQTYQGMRPPPYGMPPPPYPGMMPYSSMHPHPAYRAQSDTQPHVEDPTKPTTGSAASDLPPVPPTAQKTSCTQSRIEQQLKSPTTMCFETMLSAGKCSAL